MARTNKPRPELTFEERLNAASAQTAAALSVFEVAASDLEKAADEREVVAQELAKKQIELTSEAYRLFELEAEALDSSEANRNTANKIRAFVGN